MENATVSKSKLSPDLSSCWRNLAGDGACTEVFSLGQKPSVLWQWKLNGWIIHLKASLLPKSCKLSFSGGEEKKKGTYLLNWNNWNKFVSQRGVLFVCFMPVSEQKQFFNKLCCSHTRWLYFCNTLFSSHTFALQVFCTSAGCVCFLLTCKIFNYMLSHPGIWTKFG